MTFPHTFEALSKHMKSHDPENKGTLTRPQILEAFREIFGINYSEEYLDRLISEVDKLGSGNINYQELIDLQEGHEKVLLEEKIASNFKRFDPDNEKSIHYREMKDAVRQLEGVDAEKAQKISKDIDKTSKGLIKFKDAYKVIKAALQIL